MSLAPSVGVDTPTSAAELHLPKQQLDGLGAEKTLRIPARNGEDGCTWYRLDDLLHDVEGLLLKGWVRVEDNNAQWHSPWDWSGYAAILNGDSLESCQAYALKVQGILPSEKDRARAAQLADLSDRGPIRNRLFDLIGRGPNPGEVMSAEQLQQALRLPAQAQSVSVWRYIAKATGTGDRVSGMFWMIFMAIEVQRHISTGWRRKSGLRI